MSKIAMGPVAMAKRFKAMTVSQQVRFLDLIDGSKGEEKPKQDDGKFYKLIDYVPSDSDKGHYTPSFTKQMLEDDRVFTVGRDNYSREGVLRVFTADGSDYWYVLPHWLVEVNQDGSEVT